MQHPGLQLEAQAGSIVGKGSLTSEFLRQGLADDARTEAATVRLRYGRTVGFLPGQAKDVVGR